MIKQLSVLILFAFLASSGFAQESTLESLKAGFEESAKIVRFGEKVFVHIDKPGYVAGETVWFKTYVLGTSDNKPSTLSKVVYVELLNERNERVQQAKVNISDGTGDGSLYLPFELASGSYRFRAYTNWMKNFGAENFFQQDLVILNSLSAPPAGMIIQPSDTVFTAAFYPEGGHLVAGLESRVGFKVTGADGRGAAAKGILLNASNDTLASFSTHRFGLGQFGFTPVSGESYHANVTVNGSTKTIELPGSMPGGYVLSVAETGSLLKVTVRATSDLSGQPVYLLAHNHHELKSGQYQVINGSEAAFLLDKSQLGEGLATVTLFNAAGLPLAERLVSGAMVTSLPLEVMVDRPEHGQREEVRTTIRLPRNVKGSSLSIGTYKMDGNPSGDIADIGSYLWLVADLPGLIESPSYYLQNNPDAAIAKENLLLTHGWRQFKTDAAVVPTPVFRFLPEYEGAIVSGTVKLKSNGQPVAGVDVYVAPIGAVGSIGLGKTTADGHFNVVLKSFYGKSDLVVQTARNAQDYIFEINDPYAATFASSMPFGNYLSRSDSNRILEAGINAQAQNIFLGNRLQRLSDPYHRDSTAFYGTPDGKYMLDKFTRFNTMEEVMREYVSAVNVRKVAGKFHYRVNNVQRDKFFSEDPLVLLDGVPVFNTDKIANYNPLKVWKIEVMHTQYLLNGLAIPGIVSYRTYENNMPGFVLDAGALIVNYDGLQQQREFYQPAYTSSSASARIPDFRTQLLWDANLSVGADGIIRRSFFTSDLKGRFITIVQGMSADGKTGSASVEFEVK